MIAAVLDAAKGERSRSPGRALELARAAETLARRVGGPEGIDLRARAVGEQANALRLLGSLGAAREGWDEALELASCGSGEPLLTAWISWGRATLEIELGRPEAAIRQLETAAGLFRALGSSHEVALVEWSMARALAAQGRPGDAQRVLLGAATRLEVERDPHLVWGMWRNIALYSAEAGDTEAGLRILDEVAARAAAWGGPLGVARCEWVRARILDAAGNHARAARLLRRLLSVFQERPYELGLLATDLAIALATAGRLAAARRAAGLAAAHLEAAGAEASPSSAALCGALSLEDDLVAGLRRARSYSSF